MLLVFRRPIIFLGMAAVAALSLCACGRNGSLELPPGPARYSAGACGLERAAARPRRLGRHPPRCRRPDPRRVFKPAPAVLSAPPPGPVASDAFSTAPPTSQDTIAKTGFDAHGNPAATPSCAEKAVFPRLAAAAVAVRSTPVPPERGTISTEGPRPRMPARTARTALGAHRTTLPHLLQSPSASRATAGAADLYGTSLVKERLRLLQIERVEALG